MYDDLKHTISADTLFHFTNSFENLISILKNEFTPRYSLEDFKHFHNYENTVTITDNPDEHFKRAVPMVCFCDIPLSQIKNHIRIYGGYGIGLDKEWGKEQGLNPIMYIEPNSMLTKLITKNRELTMWNQIDSDDIYDNILSEMSSCSYNTDSTLEKASGALKELEFNNTQILYYSKEYEGKFWKAEAKNIKSGKYRFYDEREWRYVPSPLRLKELELPLDLLRDTFFDEEEKEKYNQILFENLKLSFKPNDIKYIFVKDDKEALELAWKLREIKEKFSGDDVMLLTTRIVTLEQIKNDF